LDALEPHGYCPTHLKLRHRASCETIARRSVISVLKASEEELNQVTKISELNHYDSLKDEEFSLLLEQLLGIEIRGNWGNWGIAEITTCLEETLAANQRFLTEAELDLTQAHERIIANTENVGRQVGIIVKSDLFKDYVMHLGYSEAMLQNTLSVFVSGCWIQHVFTIPNLKRGKLEYVHVFLLTAHDLVHIFLKRDELQVQSWPAKHVYLKYTLQHSNGRTSKIVVQFALGVDSKVFEFSDAAGIEGALRFYEKWMQVRNK
jgi:hypothetical protein